MLNSKDENHKNVRKSWQSLFKSQLYGAKNICSWYLFPIVKIIANSSPSETHGFSHWQRAKQEPCELYKARHINDYPLALPQKLFIFISASKTQDKMLINWITIIWPAMQTIWVTQTNIWDWLYRPFILAALNNRRNWSEIHWREISITLPYATICAGMSQSHKKLNSCLFFVFSESETGNSEINYYS